MIHPRARSVIFCIFLSPRCTAPATPTMRPVWGSASVGEGGGEGCGPSRVSTSWERKASLIIFDLPCIPARCAGHLYGPALLGSFTCPCVSGAPFSLLGNLGAVS